MHLLKNPLHDVTSATSKTVEYADYIGKVLLCEVCRTFSVAIYKNAGKREITNLQLKGNQGGSASLAMRALQREYFAMESYLARPAYTGV
ncbi:hypothetical protein AnigIFM60653_003045 [Aspergillus niger]|nr:hypothetical protein AnigIFM60653_003045 [Aspergillus niger]